jgi:hypothetical protein
LFADDDLVVSFLKDWIAEEKEDTTLLRMIWIDKICRVQFEGEVEADDLEAICRQFIQENSTKLTGGLFPLKTIFLSSLTMLLNQDVPLPLPDSTLSTLIDLFHLELHSYNPKEVRHMFKNIWALRDHTFILADYVETKYLSRLVAGKCCRVIL